MKVLAKVLYIILGVIVAICLLILLCEFNPDVTRTVSELTKGFIPAKQDVVEESTGIVSVDVSALASTEELKEVVEEDSYFYDDYTDKRDMTDIVDSGVVEDYSQSEDDDPYKKLIEDDATADEEIFDDDYFDQFSDKSDYVVTEPIIYDITDESEANDMIDNTGYGETGDNEEFASLYYPYYQMLNEKGKRLYKQIYANSNALIDEFKPIEDCTPKEWIAAFDCVFYDHPELFWMDISKYYECDFKGNVIKVQLYFYKEIPYVEKAKLRFNTDAEEILALASDLPSDYEKEKYIHDLLVDKITYQHNSMDQSSYSSIPNDYTVCCGYAKAFQYLLQKLEIPTYFCVGWGGGMHAWNIIKLDDDYYNVDCTWDDTDPSTYDYFNVTDRNNLMHSRMYQSRYLPACNGTRYGGLEEEKLDLSDYDLSSNDVYTDYDTYVQAFLDTVATNYLAGQVDSEVKFVISQDMFMEWYLLNFENMYGEKDSGSRYYDDESFTFSLSYHRLKNGDYLITHIVHFKE